MENKEKEIINLIIKEFNSEFPGKLYKYLYKKPNNVHLLQVNLEKKHDKEKFANFYINALEYFNKIETDNMLCIVKNDSILDFSFPDLYSLNTEIIEIKESKNTEFIESETSVEYAA